MPRSRSPKETVETMDLTNRELMLDIHYQVIEINGHLAEINGTVQDHCDEIHGNPHKQVVGLKPQSQQNSAYIMEVRTILKVIAAVLAALVPAILILSAKVF